MACSSCAQRRAAALKKRQAAIAAAKAEAAKKAKADTDATPSPSAAPGRRFALTTTTGKMTVFGSRLEAEAARVRVGGGTITTTI